MNTTQNEITVQSNPTLESEINAARINALELKLETLSIITESLWTIIEANKLKLSDDLKAEMAKVIDARTARSSLKVSCNHCGSKQPHTEKHCSECSEVLDNPIEISPFDY